MSVHCDRLRQLGYLVMLDEGVTHRPLGSDGLMRGGEGEGERGGGGAGRAGMILGRRPWERALLLLVGIVPGREEVMSCVHGEGEGGLVTA